MKYKEVEMQAILSKYVTKKKKSAHWFVNLYSFYDGSNELDFLFFDEHGFSVEYEIKCGRQDALLDEFKLKVTKHELLASGDESCPNRFYMVCTPDVITKDDELPDYCGLLHVICDSRGEHSIKIIKRAKLLHKIKIEPSTLFQKVYYQLNKFQSIFFGEKEKGLIEKLKKANIVTKQAKSVKKQK